MPARDSVELADILAYRLREHLGAGVDYRATLLPNEPAIYVEMIQPAYLRGLTFTFRENEPLPEPIRRAFETITRIQVPNPRGHVQFRNVDVWNPDGTLPPVAADRLAYG